MIALFLVAWAGDRATALQEWRRSDELLEPREPTEQWVRALGRLRDTRSFDLLEPLLSTDLAEPAALALGLTPGAAEALYQLATGPGEGREGDLRWLGLEGLGRQGTQGDVPTVIAALEQGWPYDEAAARALLRLHRRGLDVSKSLAALDRPYVDPRTEIAVAQTAARAFEPGALKNIDWRLARTSPARSAFLKATGQHLEWGFWDRPVVQVEALRQATQSHQEQVLERLTSEDPWIRFAAIAAAGRLRLTGPLLARLDEVGGAEAAAIHQALGEGMTLEDLSKPRGAVAEGARPATEEETRVLLEGLGSDDPWQRMAAAAASGDLQVEDPVTIRLDAVDWGEGGIMEELLAKPDARPDYGQPLVAAVWVRRQTDADRLLNIATRGNAPHVRSAAAERLLSLEPPAATRMKLLESPDSAVREAAFDALEPSAAAIEEVVFSLRVEKDPSALGAGLNRLIEWDRSGHTVPASRFLKSTLKRAMSGRDTRVRQLATQLSRALQLELIPPPPPSEQRELILPDGTVTTTVGDLPELAQVALLEHALVYTTRGRFVIDLAPEVAPLAVHNFVALARGGFYTELPWHRVVPGFVAQGGCPRGDGWGGPGWMIVDEVSDRPFVDGAVGMARGPRDTGGSQLFVMTGPARFLEGDYTWFGQVIEGMDIVRGLSPDDQILNIEIQRAP